MRDYLDGKNLYGDDFSLEKINLWFNEESEGYANIENTDKLVNIYAYHELNGSSSNLVGQFFDKYSISRWPC